MEYVIREVEYDNIDFMNLCKKLDDFQNEVFPERVNLGLTTALDGLEKLEKVFLVYDGDRAIASIALKPVNNITAEVARVYTVDNYRGMGLSKMLFDKIILYAKDKEYKKLVLDTWKFSVSARALYKKLGFIEIPTFDIDTLKNSFAMDDEEKLRKIREVLICMEKDI